MALITRIEAARITYWHELLQANTIFPAGKQLYAYVIMHEYVTILGRYIYRCPPNDRIFSSRLTWKITRAKDDLDGLSIISFIEEIFGERNISDNKALHSLVFDSTLSLHGEEKKNTLCVEKRVEKRGGVAQGQVFPNGAISTSYYGQKEPSENLA